MCLRCGPSHGLHLVISPTYLRWCFNISMLTSDITMFSIWVMSTVGLHLSSPFYVEWYMVIYDLGIANFAVPVQGCPQCIVFWHLQHCFVHVMLWRLHSCIWYWHYHLYSVRTKIPTVHSVFGISNFALCMLLCDAHGVCWYYHQLYIVQLLISAVNFDIKSKLIVTELIFSHASYSCSNCC